MSPLRSPKFTGHSMDQYSYCFAFHDGLRCESITESVTDATMSRLDERVVNPLSNDRTAGPLAGDVPKSEPRGYVGQVSFESWFGLRGCARLPADRLDPQRICRSIGLEVNPSDKSIAKEERQHVVAVDP